MPSLQTDAPTFLQIATDRPSVQTDSPSPSPSVAPSLSVTSSPTYLSHQVTICVQQQVSHIEYASSHGRLLPSNQVAHGATNDNILNAVSCMLPLPTNAIVSTQAINTTQINQATQINPLNTTYTLEVVYYIIYSFNESLPKSSVFSLYDQVNNSLTLATNMVSYFMIIIYQNKYFVPYIS